MRRSGLEQSAVRGVTPVTGDVTALPLADGAADVVVAGEILEHVADLPAAVAELCRVLRPGGLLVLDTVNDTRVSRFITVTLGERVGAAPIGIHDPDLFVDPAELTAECARHGVRLRVRGLRPSTLGLLRWLFLPNRTHPGPLGRMIPTRSTAVVYQGVGRKQGEATR
jgi:2-polyprenyl-6-hydroxyphenyl methylase/3-demethylubiquinone-9 3-methyltransferase